MSAASAIPAVPPDPPDPLPALVPEVLDGWRLHFEKDPRRPPATTKRGWRFHAPAGEYDVTYANEDQYAAFAETYRDKRVIAARQASRYLSRIRSTRELNLLRLDDDSVLAAFD